MANSAVVGILRALLVADTAQFDKAMAGADTATKRLANTMKKDLEPSQARVNSLVRQFAGSKEIGMANAYAKAIEQAGGVTKLTAEHQAQANRVVQQALTHYQLLGQKAPVHLLALQQQTKKVEVETVGLSKQTKVLQQNTMSLGGAFSSIRGLLGAFGLTAGVAGLVSFGKSAADSAGQIVDLSAKTGLSIGAVQLYGAVAKQTGGDLETFANSIFKLGINLAKGGKEIDAALKQLGVSAAEIRAASPEQQFEIMAEKLRAVTNEGERNRLGVLLFGKTWKDIAPGVVQGIKEIKDATVIASDAAVKAVDAATDAWDRFLENSKNKTIQFLGGVVLAVEEAKRRLDTGQAPPIPAGMGGLGFNWVSAWAGAQAKVAQDERNKKIMATALLGSPGAMDSLELFGDTSKGLPVAAATAGKAVDSYASSLASARKELASLSGETKKQIVAGLELGDSVKEIAESLSVSEAVVKLYSDGMKGMGEASRKAEAETQRHLEAVEKFTGVKLRKDLQQFTKDFTAAMKAGGIAKSELEPSIKTIEAFILAGENIEPAMMKWFTNASVNRIVGNNDAIQRSILRTAINFNQMVTAIERAKSLPISTTPWASLLGGSISNADLQAQAKIPAPVGLRDVVTKQLRDAASAFPELLVKAILHGQGLKRAFSAFAAQFGTEFGAAALLKMSKGMSQQQANMGVGFATFGIGLVVNDINQSMADAEAYRQKLAALKQESREFGIAYDELLKIRKANLQAGEHIFGNQPSTILKQLKDAAAKIDTLKSSLEAFGGVVPKSLDPMVQKLLQINGLPDVLRKQLESLIGQPSWETRKERAEALGINLDELGGGFNQDRVKSEALALVRTLQMFKDAGDNMDAVLRGAADEVVALLVQAQKTGAALPKTLEPFIKRLAEMGLLIDENGNAIELGAFSFQDFEDEALVAMKDLLTEIKDILAKAFPAAADAAAKAFTGLGNAAKGFFGQLPKSGTVDAGFRFPDMSSSNLQAPSIGTSFDGAAVVAGNQMMTVILEQDGRQAARFVAPYMPGEVKRLGLARI